MDIPSTIDTKAELVDYMLQFGLLQHGYNPGPLDGVRGVKTESALDRAFQDHCKTVVPVDIPEYAKLAYEYVGLSEVPGVRNNPTILAWIKSFFPWAKDDGELAWCAIFIHQMLKKAGIKGTGKANARSYLNWGEVVPEGQQKKGDIVIFWRNSPSSWQGHVGIYWGPASGGYIKCLGGNQGNKVSVANYPVSRVLGYRRAI